MKTILMRKFRAVNKLVLLIGVIVWVVSSTIANGQTIDKELGIKDSLVKVSGNKIAAAHYNKKLLKQPKNSVYLTMLGFIYLNVGEYPKAEKYLKEAIISNKHYFTYYGLGALYFQTNKYEKALENINISKELNPQFVKNYVLLGQIAMSKSDYDGCISIVNEGLKIDSTNGKFYLLRGMAYDAKGLAFNAGSDLRLATKLDSLNAVAWSKRAIHTFNKGLLKEGYEFGLKAIKLTDSTDVEFWHFLGLAGQYNNKLQESVGCFNRCISLDKNPMYYKLRSASKYLQEDMDGACADLRVSSNLYINQKIQNEEFNDVKQQLIKFCDSTKEAYYYQRGIALYNLKKFPEAIKMYTKGLKKFPNGGATYSFKGNAYMEVDSNEQAILCYQLSNANKDNLLLEYQSNPQYASRGMDTVNLIFKTTIAGNYSSMAECYLRLNDIDEALKYINMGMKEMPAGFEIGYNFTLHNLRAQIYAARGEYNSANLDFNKAISINPYNPRVYVQRAYMKYCQANNLGQRKVYLGFSDQRLGSVQIPVYESKLTNNSLLYSALKDCSIAIDNDTQYGWAYYLRGIISRQLNKPDYCKDFLEAKRLGIELTEQEIKSCLR